ncbi:hypothetical protein ACWCQ1_23955 [Streptomyces sp. NPDC002144]
MLEQTLMALAAAGGAAVVRAAGTDAWTELRAAVARWFGRGDGKRERAELERLDQTAGELQSAETDQAEVLRIRQESAWQARFEALLEGLDHGERVEAAEDLRSLLAQHSNQGVALAGAGGLAVGGNMDIRAEKGSIAAGVIHGGAHVGRPQAPDPSQG